MPALLILSGISKTFANGTVALGPMDISIQEGEFVSLVGPSGCGKSTALRLIAGLIAPSGGTVEFPQGRPETGFVFQEPTLMPWADALANAMMPLKLKGVAASEAEDRAAAALKRVGLSDFLHAYPRALSGGMKMRVSIARALAAGPKLLLMDEPFAALDEFTRQALNDDLLALWAEDKLTVTFVTHSVFESAYLSTRVVMVTPRPGRIAAVIDQHPPVPRDASFRLTPEFSAYAGHISNALKQAMEGAH
jgi:NitT/TauT family transport system ATP-binding protein